MILSVILSLQSQAQNLVPNPSFEEYDTCPTQGVTLGQALFWTVPAAGSTPDYYNRCSTIPGKWVPENSRGVQEPVTGDAYMGFAAYGSPSVPDKREAISVQLLSPLFAGEQYVYRAFFNFAEISSYRIGTVGYLLSEQALTDPIPIVEREPTFASNGVFLGDTLDWIAIQDTVTATGGERFLTITNFLPGSLSEPVYIADVMGSGGGAYYYVDDVWLSHIDSVGYVSVGEPSIEDYNLSVYPNPNNGQFNIQLSLADEEVGHIEVFNVAGMRVHNEVLSSGINTVQLQVAGGLYLYRVSVNNEPQWTGKLSVGIGQ
jgi:hypothetical protein